MVSWLVRSTPDRVVCVRARHFTLTVPLSTQVHEWVPANLMPGVNLRWTDIPSSDGVTNRQKKKGILKSLHFENQEMMVQNREKESCIRKAKTPKTRKKPSNCLSSRLQLIDHLLHLQCIPTARSRIKERGNFC